MVVINPIDQAPVQFNGCCRPDGLCGYAVNTANLSGPNLGCTSASAFGGPAVKCTPGSETPPPASADGGPGNCAVSDGGIPN